MAVADGLLSLQLPAVPASVRAARVAAVDALPGGSGDPLAQELQLVVSELVSNAIEHGSGEGDTVELELSRRGDCVLVVVRDPARNRGSVPVVLTPDGDRVRGRGLHVVDGIATDWGERIAGGRREVWAELTPRTSP